MRNLLLLIGFIPLISLAQPMPMPPGNQPFPCNVSGQKIKREHPKPGLQQTFKYIELSEPQRNEINYLLDSTHQQMSEYKQKQHELKEQLEWLATSLEFDNNRAADLIKQIADLTVLQLQNKTDTQHKIISLLTEQQKAMLSMQQKISLFDRY